MSRSMRLTRAPSTIATPHRRRIAASLVALALLSAFTLTLATAAGAQPRVTAAPSDRPKVYQASGHGTALAHGVVDLAKLPTIPPHAVTSVQTPPLPTPDALTPAQRQSYNDRMRQVRATATVQPTKAPAKISPSFVGGGTVPLLVKQFDGLNSTQANGGTGEAAIA